MGITKCNNNKCPLASKCYRVLAKDNPIMQSYQSFRPKVVKGVVECEFFMHKKENFE